MTPSEVDWGFHDACPVCKAKPGHPCDPPSPALGGVHPGRPWSATRHSTVMHDAVTADLALIDVAAVPGGQTYRATALWLAGVIDARGTDDGPSVTAKLADQLTKVMQALTGRGGGKDDDGFQQFTESISEPVVG